MTTETRLRILVDLLTIVYILLWIFYAFFYPW